MQFIQMTIGRFSLTRFTAHYLSSCVADPSHIGNHYFYYRSPHWVPNCCMVLSEQMFVQGPCVERNKTSGLTDLILNLTLENETDVYTSRRKTKTL